MSLKPQSAFQFYLKSWKNMSEEEKAPFILMAQRDKIRYENEKLEKELKEEEEVKKQQIYLRAYTGGYSAVGLDNGARCYDTVGPITKINEYDDIEQKKWGVKVKSFEYRDKNNSKWTLHHNKKYHVYTKYGDENKIGNNVYTHGTNYNRNNDRPYKPIPKYNICKELPEHIGAFTQHYTSFDNNTWITK